MSRKFIAHKSTIESITTATYNVSHSFGNGDVSVTVTTMDSISIAARFIVINRYSGGVTLYFENIPTAGTMTIGVDIRLTI